MARPSSPRSPRRTPKACSRYTTCPRIRGRADRCGVLRSQVGCGQDRHAGQRGDLEASSPRSTGTAAQVVLDPVLAARHGRPTSFTQTPSTHLKKLLVRRARVFTPNLFEAATLLDVPMAQEESGMHAQAQVLLALGAGAVLIKGGRSGDREVDVLVEGKIERVCRAARCHQKYARHRLHARRRRCRRPRQGATAQRSGAPGQGLCHGAIAAADRLEVGAGRGPLHHFYKWCTRAITPPSARRAVCIGWARAKASIADERVDDPGEVRQPAWCRPHSISPPPPGWRDRCRRA